MTEYLPTGLLRRLMCIFYDSLLLIALLFVVGIIVASLATFLFNDGHAITPDYPWFTIYQVIVLLILLLTGFVFFGWFWTHGGQTLGMRTWRVRLVNESGDENVSWRQSALRYIAALLSWLLVGLGFFYCLIDREKRSWHDLISRTRLVRIPKG